MGAAVYSEANNSSSASVYNRNLKKSNPRNEDLPQLARSPLLSSGKDDSPRNRRPRTKEVSSRYLTSYNTSTSSSFPESTISRLDHSRSNYSNSSVVSETSTRRNHCTIRRFSVSFQGESFTIQTSKPTFDRRLCSTDSCNLSSSSDTDSASSGSNSNLQTPLSDASSKLKKDGPLISPRTVLSPSKSPCRATSKSTCRANQPGNAPSIVNFAAEFLRKGKKGEIKAEEAHSLGLLHNRLLQWRFVNARASSSILSQKVALEKSFLKAWQTTTHLRDSVVMKKVMLHLLRRNVKLGPLLKEQMIYLDEWPLMDTGHTNALNELIDALRASILRLPLIKGAKASVRDLNETVCSAVDMMQLVGSSLSSVLQKAEQTASLVTELRKVASRERGLLQEYRSLLCLMASLHVKQCSLRTHLQQLNRETG